MKHKPDIGSFNLQFTLRAHVTYPQTILHYITDREREYALLYTQVYQNQEMPADCPAVVCSHPEERNTIN